MPIKFILTAFGAATVISLVSLLWPKITSQIRPGPLQQVHDLVSETPWGKKSAEVLGVTNEEQIQPVNLPLVVSQAAASLLSTVQQKTTEVIVERVVSQVVSQFDRLPEGEKQQIQEIICKPSKE